MTFRIRWTSLAATALVAGLASIPAFALPFGFGPGGAVSATPHLTWSIFDTPNAGALLFESAMFVDAATDFAGPPPPAFNASFAAAGEAIPEPSTLLLIGGALVALAILARRR